jgi:hypothetical protein
MTVRVSLDISHFGADVRQVGPDIPHFGADERFSPAHDVVASVNISTSSKAYSVIIAVVIM